MSYIFTRPTYAHMQAKGRPPAPARALSSSYICSGIITHTVTHVQCQLKQIAVLVCPCCMHARRPQARAHSLARPASFHSCSGFDQSWVPTKEPCPFYWPALAACAHAGHRQEHVLWQDRLHAAAAQRAGTPAEDSAQGGCKVCEY